MSDSQLRWIGPEKGAVHLAVGAVVNALWDLWAKALGKPVWRVVADMTPEQVVDCVDFRYMTDALTPAEALALLRARRDDGGGGGDARLAEALAGRAVPAYTTSAGWLGYDDERLRRLLRDARARGFRHFKLKVGASVADDRRRLAAAREELGYGDDAVLMVDANQVWSVPEAFEHMDHLCEFRLWFVEEPTSPDDIAGHKAVRDALAPRGVGVATGEMCHNRVMFKQLLAAGAIDVCQVDA